ncbi:MAG: hypothetical protein E4H13_03620 [Calditrichales bacterium]|nr:MAG: hypothetical protein E4H13_03620 [Calditrichales bacterium]
MSCVSQPAKRGLSGKLIAYLIGIIWLAFSACSPQVEPIRFGNDMCVYCKMMISDTRFGAALLTAKGKTYKYDSVECMAAYFLEERVAQSDIHSMWVIDFDHPEKLIDAQTAVYLESEALHSPMGLNLSAFSGESQARKMEKIHPGNIKTWLKVQNLVESQWLSKHKQGTLPEIK